MAEVAQPILRVTVPSRSFKDHENTVLAVGVFPDGRRMVTGSIDKSLLLWDLENSVVLKKMEGHGASVKAVAISKDGQLIASGDEKGQLIAWNGDTGEPLTEAIKVHSTWIRSLDFSPDGTALASGSWDKTTELWHTKSWQVQGNPIICGGEVNSVRYSPSGEFLAIASVDLIICNPHTKERIATLKTTSSPCAFSLAWTPNGARLLSAGTLSDPTIREWDSSTWKQVGDPWVGHTDYIHALAIDNTGTLVVSGCKDNHARLWRIPDRRTIAIFKDTHEVCCVTFSPDSTHVLSGGRNMMVKEWAIPEGTLLEGPSEEQMPEGRDSDLKASIASSLPQISTPQISAAMAETSGTFTRITTPVRTYKDHKETVHAVAVFSDGRRMVTGSYDNMVHLWDLTDGVLLKKMEGHGSWVWAVAVTRDGKLIASGDDTGQLIVWHGDTGEPVIQAVKVHSGRIRSLDFSPDGALLATGSVDKTAELWSTETWKVLGNPINCGGVIYCVRFSPSGEHLAISTDSDKDILIYDAWTRVCIANLKTASNPTAGCSLAWMPDGTRLFSGGPVSDPNIREWDTSTWKQVGEAWTGHAHTINVLAMNPNATFMASGSDDNLVRLWRLSDRRTIVIFKDTHEVYCGVFSMDGKRILGGGRNMMIKEWELPGSALLEDIPKEQAASSLRPRLKPSTSTATAEAMQVIPRFATPLRAFKDHTNTIFTVVVFPDGNRMVTGSMDKTLLLWNLKDGSVLKKMEGHKSTVRAAAISQDGKLIASGDEDGALIAWQGDTGEPLTEAIKIHTTWVRSLDFSPDGTAMASGSWDKTTELWCTKTWQVPGNPINCGGEVNCVQYSPSGEFLAIAGADILICKSRTGECIATLKTASSPWAYALSWTLDGTRLFSGGTNADPNIREWDTSTWKQIGDQWSGHTDYIYAITVNPAGTLVASACKDNHVRLWRISDRRTIAIFKDPYDVYCATFSPDGKRIFSGGRTMMAKEWEVPEDALPDYTPKEQMSEDTLQKEVPEEQAATTHALSEDASKEQARSKHPLLEDVPEKQATDDPTFSEDIPDEQASHEHTPCSCTLTSSHDVKVDDSPSKVISISTTALNACITGDLPLAEDLLTQEIDGEPDNYNSYANRAFVMARKSDWDRALHDALKSVSIQPSLIGYISKGISLCGKMNFQDATKAFDVAFMFTDGDSRTTHLLLLIKAVALFNANQHEEAMLRIQELITVCPKADILACRVVKAYLHVQLGVNALHHDEAADHFTTAVKSIPFSSESDIHSKYETFVLLFGWDLQSLWKTANQKRCHALLHAGRITEALKSHRYMMDTSDEATRASCYGWSTGFKRDCGALYAASGDTSLTAGRYDEAIELYSAAIDLDSATDTIFANRSKAKLEKLLWEDALVDAQKVIELNPSSYLGHQLKHAALDGTQRYDEAIEAFTIMLSKLDNAPDAQTQELRQRYVSIPEAEGTIRKVIDAQLENAPPRLLNTTIGRLCDREAQINTFKTSTEFKMLLSYTIKHAELGSERIQERIQDVVVTYFRYAMLSHRWTGKEPLLQDVQDKALYEMSPVGGISKLQSFCKTALAAGYFWAWSDTCCIDKNNNLEVQESVNTMFVWYSHSALTIIYLADVRPSSKSGALARSAWNRRGWTVQEFLAPTIVLFYQEDWTLYLGDSSPNHKESVAIMQELGYATGIDARALTAFRPGMKGAREKLQWSSMRITTLQEDMAYSLFGIFGVHLPVIYGEKKQNALGRLLQEIVARSGDISALDWVGKSSEFNSCLPADIISYKALPNTLPSLSEDQIQESISSLRNLVAVDLASKLYNLLDSQSVPRFANCRLQLPCIVFHVTEIRRSRARDQKITYEVKANGLFDLSIITEDKLLTRQTLLLVYPWNRYLLEPPNTADDTQIVDDYYVTDATGKDEPSDTESRWRFIDRVRQPVSAFFDAFAGPVDSESHSRALRLIVRLGQPFRALLLAQQRGGEYKRIASDHDIIAQVQDVTSVRKMFDVRTIEIL